MLAVLPSDPRWSFIEVPTKEGAPLNCLSVGRRQGSAVLFLHGWPGFWYDWRRVIPMIEDRYHVIAPDFRGFGDTKALAADAIAFGPESQARAILELVEHLGLSDVLLVGHDIGSTIAQSLVRMQPAAFRGLILCNPSYPGIGARRFDPAVIPHFWYQGFHNLDLSVDLIGGNRENTAIYLRFLHTHWGARHEAFLPEEIDAIIDKFSRPGAFSASIQYYRARAAGRASQAKIAPAHHRIETPTLVCWGDRDPVMRVEWSDRLGEYFPNLLGLKVLPGVGHFVPVEAPDDVVEAIQQFE